MTESEEYRDTEMGGMDSVATAQAPDQEDRRQCDKFPPSLPPSQDLKAGMDVDMITSSPESTSSSVLGEEIISPSHVGVINSFSSFSPSRHLKMGMDVDVDESTSSAKAEASSIRVQQSFAGLQSNARNPFSSAPPSPVPENDMEIDTNISPTKSVTSIPYAIVSTNSQMGAGNPFSSPPPSLISNSILRTGTSEIEPPKSSVLSGSVDVSTKLQRNPVNFPPSPPASPIKLYGLDPFFAKYESSDSSSTGSSADPYENTRRIWNGGPSLPASPVRKSRMDAFFAKSESSNSSSTGSSADPYENTRRIWKASLPPPPSSRSTTISTSSDTSISKDAPPDQSVPFEYPELSALVKEHARQLKYGDTKDTLLSIQELSKSATEPQRAQIKIAVRKILEDEETYFKALKPKTRNRKSKPKREIPSHRGGTSSLATYEYHHQHISYKCDIKHDEERFPYGFNPKLMKIFRQCSRDRLKRERSEKHRIHREQVRKGKTHVHINPILDEDTIRECGGESYKDLEGRVDEKDMKGAAIWEMTTRRITGKTSRKSRSTRWRKRESPLRKELEFRGDHWIPRGVWPVVKTNMERGVKVQRLGCEEEWIREGMRHQDMDEEEALEKEAKEKAFFEQKIREEEVRQISLANVRLWKEKQRMIVLENRKKEMREKGRVAWENRERSECCVTQAWIDLGADMKRVGCWD